MIMTGILNEISQTLEGMKTFMGKIYIKQTYGSATFGNDRDFKIAVSKIPEGMRTLIGEIQGIYFRNLVVMITIGLQWIKWAEWLQANISILIGNPGLGTKLLFSRIF